MIRFVLIAGAFAVLLVGVFSTVPTQSAHLAGISEGWIDDDTYRFTGVGIGRRTAKSPEELMRTACQAAILHAQYTAIEKLGHAGSKLVSGTVDFSTNRSVIMKEVGGVVRGGAVINQTYDPKTNACTVIYEFKEKDLKEKVRKAVLNSLNRTP